MSFKITPEDTRKILEWVESHECDLTEVGAIGGAVTYSFTPTSIGTTFKVNCACESQLDLTDYGAW